MAEEDRAREILVQIGGNELGQPQVANEAVNIAIEEAEDGDDLVAVSWDIFRELLEDYELIEDAINYLLGTFLQKGYSIGEHTFYGGRFMMTDRDIDQLTAIAIWRSFGEFSPSSAKSLRSWIAMIRKRRKNDALRRYYNTREKEVLCLDQIAEVETQASDRQGHGWSIPEICVEWIEYENDDQKAAFAAHILAMYQGQLEWIGPTGSKMATRLGMSRGGKLLSWWREFVQEVIKRESKC